MRYREFVLKVTRRTARLAAMWQCLGAVHGKHILDTYFP